MYTYFLLNNNGSCTEAIVPVRERGGDEEGRRREGWRGDKRDLLI